MKQEIRNEAIKQSKGSSTVQRIKKINKYLNSKGITREEMKTAWLEDGKMCLTNGYTGFMFNEVLECIEIADKPTFNLSKCFPDDSDYKEVKLDIADVKYQIKLHKASETGKKAKDKTLCIYIIDGHYYNANYLVDTFDILGGDIVFKQNDNALNLALLNSENGKAIISPIRPH